MTKQSYFLSPLKDFNLSYNTVESNNFRFIFEKKICYCFNAHNLIIVWTYKERCLGGQKGRGRLKLADSRCHSEESVDMEIHIPVIDPYIMNT